MNRTCALCPLGSYQPSVGQMDCLPCGQGFITASPGAVSELQCEGGLLLFATAFMISFQTAMQSYFVGQIISNFNVNKIVNLVYIFTLKMTEIQKTPGEAKEQENADESSWKLPVIINTSSLGRPSTIINVSYFFLTDIWIINWQHNFSTFFKFLTHLALLHAKENARLRMER